MSGYLKSHNKQECYGCRLCEDICPRHAIKAREDSETFIYPYINEDKCISCGLCEKFCPYNYKISGETIATYILINNNKNTLFNSSSGGAFHAICSSVLESGRKVKVYGARWGDNHDVIMDYAMEIESVTPFMKSKYIQCNSNQCFQKIYNDLNNDYSVYFFATPCLCAAVLSYIPEKLKINLFTIDLICHGVPSQRIFDIYFTGLKKKYGSIFKYTFRNKECIGGVWDSTTAKILTENGEYILRKNDDPYLNGYYKRLFFRPGCYNCKFSQYIRITDITIGDAWHIDKYIPEYNADIGVSLVITHTNKGQNLVKNLKDIKLEVIDHDYAKKNNEALVKPTPDNPRRNKFFKYLNKYDFEKSSFLATRISFLRRIIYCLFTPKMRKNIKYYLRCK